MKQFATVLYEDVEPGIVRIRMNRPEVRNAQDLQMTYDLNAALLDADGKTLAIMWPERFGFREVTGAGPAYCELRRACSAQLRPCSLKA